MSSTIRVRADPDLGRDEVEQRDTRRLAYSEHICDGPHHERRLRDAAELDQLDPTREVGTGRMGRLDGQPGLARATGAGERHEAADTQQPPDILKLPLSTDEAGETRHRGRGHVPTPDRVDARREEVAVESLRLRRRLGLELLLQDLDQRRVLVPSQIRSSGLELQLHDASVGGLIGGLAIEQLPQAVERLLQVPVLFAGGGEVRQDPSVGLGELLAADDAQSS